MAQMILKSSLVILNSPLQNDPKSSLEPESSQPEFSSKLYCRKRT